MLETQQSAGGDQPCSHGAYVLGELRSGAQEGGRAGCRDLRFVHTGVVTEALGVDGTTWKNVEWKEEGPGWSMGHAGLKQKGTGV